MDAFEDRWQVCYISVREINSRSFVTLKIRGLVPTDGVSNHFGDKLKMSNTYEAIQTRHSYLIHIDTAAIQIVKRPCLIDVYWNRFNSVVRKPAFFKFIFLARCVIDLLFILFAHKNHKDILEPL